MADVADVPPGVVTVTSTRGGARRADGRDRGVVDHRDVVAAVVPKSTAVAPVKPVPVIVTEVPPAAEPLVGLRPVTVGGGSTLYVN